MQDFENKKWAVRGQNLTNIAASEYNNGPN